MTATDETPARPDAAPAPDGNAGGAGDAPEVCPTCKGEWADVCSNAFHLYEPDDNAGGLDGDAIQARAEFVESGWDSGVLLDDAPDGWAEAIDELTQRDVPALLAALAEAIRERDERPTVDAYRAACAAIEKHRARADTAERERDEARAKTEELLDLLRSLRTYGVIPSSLRAEIAKWIGAVEPVTDDGGAG